MSKMLTKQDCKDLSHTICGCFYHGKEKEFELWRNKKVPKNNDSINNESKDSLMFTIESLVITTDNTKEYNNTAFALYSIFSKSMTYIQKNLKNLICFSIFKHN